MPPATKVDILDRDAISNMSGLETMQAIVDGVFPPPPIGIAMNFFCVSVAKGRAEFEGEPRADFRNPHGSIHGGWYGAILDSAMGCAVHTAMAPGAAYTTLEYKINITRAIPVGTKVRAVGETSHVGRSTAVAEAKLVGIEDGRLYATGSTTCIILNPGTLKPQARSE